MTGDELFMSSWYYLLMCGLGLTADLLHIIHDHVIFMKGLAIGIAQCYGNNYWIRSGGQGYEGQQTSRQSHCLYHRPLMVYLIMVYYTDYYIICSACLRPGVGNN